MGFKILPIEEDDEDRYDIITITSPERWTPFNFLTLTESPGYFFDPSDEPNEDDDPLTSVNHMAQGNPFEELEDVSFYPLDKSMPLVDTQILATATWHKVIYKENDPKQLRPYLGWRPTEIVKKTL